MMKESYCVGFALAAMVALGIAFYVYYKKVESYCNCSGMGVQVDRPTNTFWRGAWPRSASATPLDFVNKYGTWPTGCSSPSFGWPQMADQPFNVPNAKYEYASTINPVLPYMMGPDEVRDANRDVADGLVDKSVQYSFGQTPMTASGCAMTAAAPPCQSESLGQYLPLAQIPPNDDAVAGSKCCACNRGTRINAAQPSFVQLQSIPGATLPPGAVTANRPCMNQMETRLRFGDGKYGSLGVGVL